MDVFLFAIIEKWKYFFINREKKMIRHLLENNVIIQLPSGSHLQPSTVIIRKSNNQEQQGCFSHYDEEKNLILINVLDLKEKSYLAREGVVKTEDNDSIFAYTTSFRKNPNSEKALDIVRGWSLFQINESMQEDILRFVRTTYVPEQILELEEQDDLSTLFIPIQQVFRIGEFKERRDIFRVCIDRFRQWLESLNKGEHITYLAKVIFEGSDRSLFYSIGTKPHQEIDRYLRSEEFNFIPTHGGHIKYVGMRGKKKQFHIDAGSNNDEQGIKTSLDIAQEVTEALRETYAFYEFTPLEGGEALGIDQSY